MSVPIEGQLNEREREILRDAVLTSPRKPRVVLEVGTWLGGGSTLHLLRALEQNGEGHLWWIEADSSIYEQMVANLRRAAPEALHRFTPIFGFSDQAIPKWVQEQPKPLEIDVTFLDGGNRPLEQITEFRLLDPWIPVGGRLLSHDAKLRKGKWLVPYVARLDNWKSELCDISDEGLFRATKVAAQPSPASARAAAAHLLKLRLHPAEIAAVALPASVCGLVLRCLPRRFSRRLSDGRP